jgi:hypothetical protein
MVLAIDPGIHDQLSILFADLYLRITECPRYLAFRSLNRHEISVYGYCYSFRDLYLSCNLFDHETT